MAQGATRFWLVRHALVAENDRAVLYGTMDVALCPDGLIEAAPMFAALARRLPRDAHWVVTPLSRTRLTADGILRAGYPDTPYAVEPGLIEQDLGEWQGLAHDALPPLLNLPAHGFWPLGGAERPPGGESMDEVITRVGATLERLRAEHAGGDVVAVSHGGAIRAAVAHVLRIAADNALHLAVQNLSLTCLEHSGEGWRVLCVNETPGC